MELIYTARNDLDAHFLQGLLEQEGITSVIQGEALEGAWSTVPLSANSLPGLWVNEADVARAAPIVEEYRQREDANIDKPAEDAPAGPTWICPKCGEAVEDQFDECWNCQTERPNVASQ